MFLILCVCFLTLAHHAHTRPHPQALLFYHSLSFRASVGRDRGRHKKDGPVSGIENGPYCFTRDLGSGGKLERETGRERERIVLTIECNL